MPESTFFQIDITILQSLIKKLVKNISQEYNYIS